MAKEDKEKGPVEVIPSGPFVGLQAGAPVKYAPNLLHAYCPTISLGMSRALPTTNGPRNGNSSRRQRAKLSGALTQARPGMSVMDPSTVCGSDPCGD